MQTRRVTSHQHRGQGHDQHGHEGGSLRRAKGPRRTVNKNEKELVIKGVTEASFTTKSEKKSKNCVNTAEHSAVK